MVEPKKFLKPKQHLDEAWDETIKYHSSLIYMSSARRDYIRNQLIRLFEKKKPTKFEIDLIQLYMKEYDKNQKFNKKTLASGVKRLDYLTTLYKQETEASKRRMENKTPAKKKTPTYNVSFRILTENPTNLFQQQGKSTRSITVGGTKYMQVGKAYSFKTKSKYFLNRFKSDGAKQDIITRATRGEKGSRWNKTVPHVMKILEELEANNIISYMDAIHITGVTDITPTPASDIKTEKKKQSGIDSIFNKYLTPAKKTYETHPYLSEHFKPESCMLTTIIEQYYEAFQKRKSNGKRMFKDNITYEYLCDLFNLECTDSDIECDIQTALIFFKKFNLGLKVYDLHMNLIEEYIPKNRSVLRPSLCSILTYNKHIYLLDDNLDMLKQKLNSTPELESISNQYKIITDFNENYKLCTSFDEIKQVVAEHQPGEKKDETINIEYYGVMNKLVHQIVFEERYMPQICLDGSMVTRIILKMKQDDKSFVVSITDVDKSLSTDSESFVVEDCDILEYATNYNKVYNDTYKWLINKRHLSSYDSETHDIEKSTMIRPICCTFKYDQSNMVALDMNKAYCSNLMDMKKFPVFNSFDKYQKYDNHKIEDYTMYYIRATNKTTASAILFQSEYSRAYGYKLNRINKDLFEILSFKRPSNLIDTHSEKKIKEIYENKDLSKTSKKQIINILLGIMEKKYTKKNKCHCFLTKEEAQYYIETYGGVLGELTYFEDTPDGLFAVGNQEERIIYTVVQSKEKELINGFLPIKEMIYDIQRYKLYQMYTKCRAHNIQVYGIKTDCVLVRESDAQKLYEVFEADLNDDIGKYKIELGKSLFGEKLTLDENENDCDKLLKVDTKEIQILNEYDKEELARINHENNRLIILGKHAGCGKSTACCQGFEDKSSVLFVSPFNKQCIELQKDGYKAITVNSFFGKGVGDNNRGLPYDWSGSKLIVFDEILLNNIHFLELIKTFVRENHDKVRIFGNGDVNQLEPINIHLNNIVDKSNYRMDCIKQIFPNALTLKEIKRLNKEEDKIKMKKIKKEIFKGVDIETICEKYGIKTIRNMEDIKTNRNIAYFNFRCNQVNTLVHKRLGNSDTKVEGVSIWKNLILQCKKHYKNKDGFKTYVNNLYRVEEINKYIKIVDIANENNVFSMDRAMLWKIFRLSYCNTCHSEQGCSIDEDITIFDSNTPYVDRYWLYTALTRVRNLSKATIYIHSPREIRRLEESKKKQYINMKIEGYKEQDRLAGREIDHTHYVDYEWFIKEESTSNCCYHCGCGFELGLDEYNNVFSNISFDRIDNSKGHNKDNLVLSCVHCNIRKLDIM